MVLDWGKWREGVVIGVSAAAFLSAATAAIEYVGNHREKREQVRHLAQLLDDYRSRIYSATDFEFGQTSATRDQMRNVHYNGMRQLVESVLRERSSRLSYDEVKEVRDAFDGYDQLGPNSVFGEEMYDHIFERLDSIEWLGLQQTGPPS